MSSEDVQPISGPADICAVHKCAVKTGGGVGSDSRSNTRSVLAGGAFCDGARTVRDTWLDCPRYAASLDLAERSTL
jgi:hypothetical protein